MSSTIYLQGFHNLFKHVNSIFVLYYLPKKHFQFLLNHYPLCLLPSLCFQMLQPDVLCHILPHIRGICAFDKFPSSAQNPKDNGRVSLVLVTSVETTILSPSKYSICMSLDIPCFLSLEQFPCILVF